MTQYRSVFISLVPLAALSLFAGCEAEDASSSALVQRDSAGIQIVENREPLWAPGEGWRLSESATLSIGTAAGPPEQQLFRVSDAVRLSDGRVVVANGGTRELKFYDSSGSHLRTVGGEGGGPGEFDNLSWLGHAGSDSLLVWDNGARRLSVFDPQGEFITSITAGQDLSGFLALMRGVFRDGSLVLQPGESPAAFAGRPTGAVRDSITLIQFDRRGELVDTLGRFPGADRFLLQRDDGFSMADVFFGRETFTAVHGDRLYVADNDSYEVAAYSSTGALRTLIRRAHEPVSVEQSQVEDAREAILAELENEDQRRRRERVLSEAPSRETFPAFEDLVVDRAGDVWLEDYRIPGAVERRWSIFDSAHRWLGSVRLPDGLRVLEIGETYVLGVERDALDVEYVRLYGLERGDT